MYGLTGKMIAQEGQRDALIGYLLEGTDSMTDLEGCYLYVVATDPADPNGIWVTEVWRSQDDHQASLSLASTQELIAKARPIIAGFGERIESTPVGGKGIPKDAGS